MRSILRESLSNFSMNGQLHLAELPPEINYGRRYEVPGNRGKYWLEAGQSLIDIRKVDERDVHLRAEINREGCVEWRLYTRRFIGIKPSHDLFASLFYDAALLYLFTQGNNTDVICEEWNSGINHAQYRAAMKDKPDVDRAIGSTYSWGRAQLNGYTRWEALSPTGLDVMSYKFLFLR